MYVYMIILFVFVHAKKKCITTSMDSHVAHRKPPGFPVRALRPGRVWLVVGWMVASMVGSMVGLMMVSQEI